MRRWHFASFFLITNDLTFQCVYFYFGVFCLSLHFFCEISFHTLLVLTLMKEVAYNVQSLMTAEIKKEA